jgi:AcrR family transcriptional regulator
MAAKTPARRGGKDRLAETIVDATLDLAGEVSWDGVRLHRVAQRLDVSLADIAGHYRDLDAIADAWFIRARDAMAAPQSPGFADLSARQRLHSVIMRWFDALSPHRRVTGQMIATKLYPSHPHHWVPLIFNLSRTIQWVRDAALLDATGRQRQIEEIGLSALFLATAAVWLRDGSADQEETRQFLHRRLAAADSLMDRIVR